MDLTDRGEKVTEVFVEFLAKIVKMGCLSSEVLTFPLKLPL